MQRVAHLLNGSAPATTRQRLLALGARRASVVGT
jgi:hypothetical protein